MIDAFQVVIQSLSLLVLIYGASRLINSASKLTMPEVFLGILASISIFYLFYLFFESKILSGLVMILLSLSGYLRMFFTRGRNSNHENIGIFSIPRGHLLIVVAIILYAFIEVSSRNLIAGDALAVYYLKAKAIYYGVPIAEMPTASYSIYPSVMWLIFSGFVGIEAGAEYARFCFTLVAVLAVYGLIVEASGRSVSSVLILSMLFAYTCIRIGGFYPISMGYFDWLVGCMLAYLAYLLLFDDREDHEKTLPILLLSFVGLVKLEGLIYANIIFLLYIMKVRSQNGSMRRPLIMLATLNLISTSYILFIKYYVGIIDYQNFHFDHGRSIVEVISLMWSEAKSFWKEALFVGLLYTFSIYKTKRIPIYQLTFHILTYGFLLTIYYTTTVDVAWHIQTSMQRLIYQTIPLILLFTSVNLRNSR